MFFKQVANLVDDVFKQGILVPLQQGALGGKGGAQAAVFFFNGDMHPLIGRLGGGGIGGYEGGD